MNFFFYWTSKYPSGLAQHPCLWLPFEIFLIQIWPAIGCPASWSLLCQSRGCVYFKIGHDHFHILSHHPCHISHFFVLWRPWMPVITFWFLCFVWETELWLHWSTFFCFKISKLTTRFCGISHQMSFSLRLLGMCCEVCLLLYWNFLSFVHKIIMTWNLICASIKNVSLRPIRIWKKHS